MIEAVMCLALNMFFETRHEGPVAQMLVAEVTINRVKDTRFPDDICGVVWQNKQFSWTHDGKSDNPETMSYLDRQAWDQTKRLAQELYDNPRLLPITGATHYHAKYVKPYWAIADDIEQVAHHGDHIFYVWKK
ncbi:cell wall hydrolase [bacterium]|nr:cell wall hydrolase [bacterium]